MTNKTNQFNEDYQKMMDDLDDQVLQEVRKEFYRKQNFIYLNLS
ncbi:hypothetical protein MAESPC_00256 [Microcystis aeruginosa SPC777]|uniref:Uncharacterized protein n=1 Tax=Microcystis aeruginosa SPC777 TaxID=482300 RepID=S3JYD2_MICAE|nr:hypothetical protein MAESPC_00256 [Microcystis aeruginosa SPC777]